MTQKIIMIILILVIVIGGGFMAYKELMPEADRQAEGPVYSTKRVVKGDINVGVETTGMLNPSRSGGIRVAGDYTMSAQFVIDEYLVKAGDEVKKGQVVARLASVNLESQTKSKLDELKMKKEQFENRTGMKFEDVRSMGISNGITITAPIDGVVYDFAIEQGAKLEQGDTIARIVDNSKFIAEVGLSSAEFKRLKAGQKVSLDFYPYFDGYYEATIKKINPNPVPYTPPAESGGKDDSGSLVKDRGEYATGFVYMATLEGNNPGLIQRNMTAQVTVTDLSGTGVQYLTNKAVVKEYVEEEKVISTLDKVVVTHVHVDNMERVTKGQPLITLAGSDVQELLQDMVDDILDLERELNGLLAQAELMEVTAPMDGIVADFYREEGESVGPGEWLGSVYTVTDMMMWCEVDDIDVLNVRQGAPVEIRVDAVANKVFEGEVLNVSTMGRNQGGVPTFGVEIRVTGGPELRPGMQARAFIKAGEAKNVLLVPVEAVFEEDGKTMVEVLNEDGSTKIVNVSLGLMNATHAEVKSGLKEGDLVITGSSYDLLPSQHIKKQNGLLPDKQEDQDNGSQNGNAEK